MVATVVTEELPVVRTPATTATAATPRATTTTAAATTDGGGRRQLVGRCDRQWWRQRCQRYVAHDPGLRAGTGRPGVAELAFRPVAKPDVQPVRGRSFRTHVQGARPESVLAGGLGEEFSVLQRFEGNNHYITFYYFNLVIGRNITLS